ncbi:MAG: SpoIIE family protein phosphatase [Holophaga sp.]|nr:SpoIIE family protein phosphatase [Holophaga sp.]
MRASSLRGRSALVLLLINLSVGILTVAGFLVTARGISQAFARRFAEKHALLDKSRILAPIQREVALALKLADSQVMRSWCRAERDPAARTMALAELESFRRAFSDHSYFFIPAASRHYYFNNATDEFHGQELRYTLDPADPANTWYFQTMATVDDFALHVDSSEQLGLLKVWINVLVKDQGRKIGLVGTGVDLSAFMQEAARSGDRAVSTVLVDRKGYLQAYPNPGYMEHNARMKDEARRMTLFQLLGSERDRALLAERIGRLSSGKSSLEVFPLVVEGRRYLAAATFMGEIEWVNLALVDPSQVMGLRPFLPILGFMLLGLVLTIGLVSLLLNRMVLQPLERLTRSSQKIAEGQYGVELPVDRQDEIGRLTGTFNHMAATIQDHTANLERKVQERTEALSMANQKLTESSRKIMDSLDYAHLIQASMLPKPETLAAAIPDNFVLFRPRDIVGGDFYALAQDPRGFLVAVGDCAGHGVPGAFMSMSASAVLEQLLAKLGPEDPARILGELNEAMKALLHQSERALGSGRLDNGLDLALVRVLPGEGRARFAGARLSLWTIGPDGALQEHKGDPQSLGYRRSLNDFHFTNQDIPLAEAGSFYLFTDGILDQHGGAQGFGFGQRRLREVILGMRDQPMAQQLVILERILRDYQGINLQRDDITFMGFRVASQRPKD